MSKKNKDIQVQLKEEDRLIEGKKETVTQLVIGKKQSVKLFPTIKIFKPTMTGIY